MADEVSVGELDRRLRDHEARTDRIHAATDLHINRVAQESVPLGVWQAQQTARDDQIRALTERVRELEEAARQAERDRDAEDRERLRERARDRRLVLAAFVSPLILLLVQLYLSGSGKGG